MSHPHLITDIDDAATFAMAGRATFTVRNTKTGNHITFRIDAVKGEDDTFEVRAFTGTENTRKDHYSVLGLIQGGTYTYRGIGAAVPELLEAAEEAKDEWLIGFCKSMLRYQAKGWDLTEKQEKALNKNLRRNRIQVSSVEADDPKALGFSWLWKRLQARHPLPPFVEFWHEGRCGRCGRKLTNPGSIESGYGPECIGLVGQASSSAA